MTCIITPVSFCNDALCHHTSQEVLKPHAYQANLDIWSFYTENYLSQFPPYDCELISHTDLTLADITHGYFSQSVLQGLRPISGVDVASTYAYLELMLIKYKGWISIRSRHKWNRCHMELCCLVDGGPTGISCKTIIPQFLPMLNLATVYHW